MKKTKTIFLLVFIMCLMLTACDPSPFYFNYDEMIGNVSSIELVEYNNSNPVMVKVKSDTELVFDLKKISSIQILDDSKINDLLNDLSTIIFHIKPESVKEPIGKCLKINLNNKDFIILSCTTKGNRFYPMVAKFNENGKFIEHLAFFADRTAY